MNVRLLRDSTDSGCDLVRRWLREHNWSVNAEFMRKFQAPEHQAVPLVVLAETDSGIIGGLLAETQLSWLRIGIMAVDPQHRSKGVGAALLAAAEREAVARGCKHAYVDTMAYQAPDFYLKHGYTKLGEIPDWDSHGHTKFFFTKPLGHPN